MSAAQAGAYAAASGFLWIEPGDGEDTVGP